MSGFITVKTGFNTFFTEPVLKHLLTEVVNAVTPILIQAQLFASYHVTILLETGQEVDQTFFNRCIAAVTKATDGSQAFDSQQLAKPDHPKHWTAAGQQFSDLTATLVDYHELLASTPCRFNQLERPAVLKDVGIRFGINIQDRTYTKTSEMHCRS